MSKEQLAEGLVEIWKHALLDCNDKLLSEVNERLAGGIGTDLIDLIADSLEIKKGYVEDDFKETNGRHLSLSLGHSLANYLEKRFHVPHGPAVLCGIVHAALLSRRLNLITSQKCNSIFKTTAMLDDYIKVLTTVQSGLGPDDYLSWLKFDKMNSHGRINLVLLASKGFILKTISEQDMKNSLEEFQRLDIYASTSALN